MDYNTRLQSSHPPHPLQQLASKINKNAAHGFPTLDMDDKLFWKMKFASWPWTFRIKIFYPSTAVAEGGAGDENSGVTNGPPPSLRSVPTTSFARNLSKSKV